MSKNVLDFIRENWDNTVRVNTADEGNRIGLPKPYTVPCVSGLFQELYYWDTYFTNVGLLLSDRADLAINNAENVAAMIHRFGKMPNGTRTHFLNRSQPPFFSQMVRDIYDTVGDAAWLGEMYGALEKEYAFWQNERQTAQGLNRYTGDLNTPADYELYCRELCDRFGYDWPAEEATQREYAACMVSFCESGWDCNSRFGLEAHRFAPVELNALLYGLETNMAHFAVVLENGEEALWNDRAAARRALMNEKTWDAERGMFCDLRLDTGRKSDFVSAAAFYPLFFGLCTAEQAADTVRLLPRLENRYGVACCEAREDLLELQWDHPHGWACLQYMTLCGLLRYGYREDALRIARKYVEVVDRNFETTGCLWEKYDTLSGTVSVTKEYESPQMMGWSAGVYLYCSQLIEE